MVSNIHRATGGCHCGNIRVELELTRAPEAYNPRACDCDFCTKHSAAYVSDPQGSLIIRIEDERQTAKYRQGSGIADCLLCRNCGVLIGATYQSDGRIYGTVNVKSLDDRTSFGAEQSVSPKKLSGGDKVKRWQDIWFANVSVVTASAEPAAAS